MIYDELDPPEGLADEEEAHEMVRFWIAGGHDHVTLNIGLFDTDSEPEIWGNVVTDIAQHAARALAQELTENGDKHSILLRIEKAFSERLRNRPGISGQIKRDSQLN